MESLSASQAYVQNWQLDRIRALEDGDLEKAVGTVKAQAAHPAARPRLGWQCHVAQRLAGRQFFTKQIPFACLGPSHPTVQASASLKMYLLHQEEC